MILTTRDSQIRLYADILADMFGSIQLLRADGSLYTLPVYLNTFDQKMKRSIEKEWIEINKGATLGPELPMVTIQVVDIMYDSTRALNKLNNKIQMVLENRRAIVTYEDVPVTINMNITVETKTTNDSFILLEAIQGEFKHNMIRKNIPLPLYGGSMASTPMVLNAITFADDLGLDEDGGRNIQFQANLNVYGMFHSYLNGKVKDLLAYYRQFELLDVDGDGIIDSYIHPVCDDSIDPASGKKIPILIGGPKDKTIINTVLENIAIASGMSKNDYLSKPKLDFNTIGDALIERILIRIWEKDIYTGNKIKEYDISDEEHKGSVI